MVRSLSSFILAVVAVFPAPGEHARYLKLIDMWNEAGLTTKERRGNKNHSSGKNFGRASRPPEKGSFGL